MAIVIDKKVVKEKVFQCDKCKKTKPYSLSSELAGVVRGDQSWVLVDAVSGRCLCDSCALDILSAWYKQQEAVHFCLQSDVSKPSKKKSRAIA